MRVTLFDIARQAGVSPTAASRDRRQREGPSAPSTLHPTPANLFVAGFTGWRAMNMLPESSRRPLRIAGAEIGDNGDNGSGCATIRLRPGGAVDGRAPNTARIRTVDDLGSEVFVHLVIGHEREDHRIVAKVGAPFEGSQGDNVRLTLRGALHLFEAAEGRRAIVTL